MPHRSIKPCQAVSAEMGVTAAAWWSTVRGFGATQSGGATQYSACVPSPNQSFIPYTRSPTAKSVTPVPRAVTSPENSWPGITGNERGVPSRVVQVGTHVSSVGVTPEAWTRTSTSPGFGSGRGTSRQASDSGPPRRNRQAARMEYSSSGPTGHQEVVVRWWASSDCDWVETQRHENLTEADKRRLPGVQPQDALGIPRIDLLQHIAWQLQPAQRGA